MIVWGPLALFLLMSLFCRCRRARVSRTRINSQRTLLQNRYNIVWGPAALFLLMCLAPWQDKENGRSHAHMIASPNHRHDRARWILADIGKNSRTAKAANRADEE